MKTTQCDILIVGGGPAGTSAALRAAGKGARVILVERKSRIGIPVRCAEYIPAPLIGQINLGRKFVVQPVKGMKTYLPDGEVKETRAPGFTIHRDQFDQALADAAQTAGVDICLSTTAAGMADGTVIVRRNGERTTIQAKIIIGADGPHSKVGQWINAPNSNLMAGAQVSAPLVRPSEYTKVYFEPWIHGGYGWVFPKKDHANVGVGIKPVKSDVSSNPGNVKNVLDAFVQKLVRENVIAPPKSQAVAAGWIPAEPMKKIHQGNILLTGDSAGHTHPITGAGIFSAVAGGDLAGKWAARAIEENDIGRLAGYEKEVKDFFGPHLKRAFDRRCFMEAQWIKNSWIENSRIETRGIENNLGDFESIIKRCWVAFGEYYGN